MPLAVGDLLRINGLDLQLIAGSSGLTRSIRWVHVSELEDPTPWRKGGELLLTTGMGVGTTPARHRAYLARLTDAGLAGLGFGTGFSFRRAPKALVDAAERAGFPLFEVPYPVPFIAITEAVFTRLVAEQYDLLSRSLESEHTLTRAVLDGEGIDGIARALARATQGWVVLLDLQGAPVAATPAAAEGYLPVLQSELQSPRAEGLRFSLSVVERGQHIAIQPVTAQGRVEAFLAVGKKEALTQFDRIVSSHAVALLALELAKARAVSETERRLKGDVLDQILRGALAPEQARASLERLGFDLARPFAVVALAGAERPESLAPVCEAVMGRRSGPFLASPRDDVVLLVFQPDRAGFLATLRAEIASRAGGPVLAGAGALRPFHELGPGVREASYSLQVCRTEGRPHA